LPVDYFVVLFGLNLLVLPDTAWKNVVLLNSYNNYTFF